jgi:hypothetical protein
MTIMTCRSSRDDVDLIVNRNSSLGKYWEYYCKYSRSSYTLFHSRYPNATPGDELGTVRRIYMQVRVHTSYGRLTFRSGNNDRHDLRRTYLRFLYYPVYQSSSPKMTVTPSVELSTIRSSKQTFYIFDDNGQRSLRS